MWPVSPSCLVMHGGCIVMWQAWRLPLPACSMRTHAAAHFAVAPCHLVAQVRAANLSGDCTLGQEMSRGNISINPATWVGQQERCIQRRAALSVALNPKCGGPAGAQRAVAQVLERCKADCDPFKSPPRTVL